MVTLFTLGLLVAIGWAGYITARIVLDELELSQNPPQPARVEPGKALALARMRKLGLSEDIHDWRHYTSWQRFYPSQRTGSYPARPTQPWAVSPRYAMHLSS